MKYSDRIKAQVSFEVTPQRRDAIELLQEEAVTDEDSYEDEDENDDDDDDGSVTPADPSVALLQTALAAEYLQWNLYTTYASRLKGFSRDTIANEFRCHAQEELDHIDLLQRYIIAMGHTPTVMRKSIPDLPSTATIKDIVLLQHAFEKEAVELYTKLLDLVDDDALRVDLENILVKEKEHVHELELMLEEPVHARVLAQIFRPMEAGEPTKPQAGYGCKCEEGCDCGGKCSYNCKCSPLDLVATQWCTQAFKELVPELYARWYQGHLLSVQEKKFIADMFAIKWGAKDSRTVLRFLEK